MENKNFGINFAYYKVNQFIKKIYCPCLKWMGLMVFKGRMEWNKVMETWLAFGAGCFVGVFIGIFIMGFLFMFRKGEDFDRSYEKEFDIKNGEAQKLNLL